MYKASARYGTSARYGLANPLPLVILSDAKNLAPRVPSWGSYQLKEILLDSDSSLRSVVHPARWRRFVGADPCVRPGRLRTNFPVWREGGHTGPSLRIYSYLQDAPLRMTLDIWHSMSDIALPFYKQQEAARRSSGFLLFAFAPHGGLALLAVVIGAVLEPAQLGKENIVRGLVLRMRFEDGSLEVLHGIRLAV